MKQRKMEDIMKKKWLVMTAMVFSILMTGCAKDEASNTSQETTVATEASASMEKEGDLVEEEQDATKQEGQTEKPIIKLAGGDTGLPNPFRHLTRGPGTAKMQILYDSLLEIDEEGYIPWLASSYSVDETGLVYSFQLVENAVWHDGIPLTVEDIIFTFDYYKKFTAVSDSLNVEGQYIVQKVDQTGDYSFDITVVGVDNTNISRLGGVRILPKHIWENVEDPFSYEGEGATVGSGPFVMTEYEATTGVYRYEAFDQYWGWEPAVQAIEWVPVSDATLAFENKEIDLINTSADLVERYQNDSQYTVQNLPSYHSYRLMINMERSEELQDAVVRQAMAYGIDRQALIDKIARGSGVISSMGYIPINSEWYNDAINQYEYSVEKSVELLAGKTYNFKILTGNTPEEVKIAELMKLDLEKIGITLEIESVETKTRDEAVKTGDYELLLVNLGGMGGDPDYLRSIYGSLQPNSTALYSATVKGYDNETLFRLAAEQAITLDKAERKTILDEMQEIIATDVPMILLYSANDNFVYRKDYYDGWYARFDHSKLDHNKLTYVIRE
jgi:peptide/nickel transport system substrate-binding protein